jgi:hypothetical protein
MFDTSAIRERIEAVAVSEAGLATDVAKGAAFHLTDWIEELSAFVAFCRDPRTPTSDEVNTMLLAFVHHAPNHLAAASKLYADFPVTDVFGVGAVGERRADV